MSALEIVANVVWWIGLVIVFPGLWFSMGGVRVVVSGRIDERRRAAKSLKLGIPLLLIGVVLLFAGTWLVNWAQN